MSTQITRQPTIAVVGRPPKGLHGVRFISRSNPRRILLDQLEVTVLEALRDFPDHSELAWPEACNRIRQLVTDGHVDMHKLAAVAATERRPGLRHRIAELIAA